MTGSGFPPDPELDVVTSAFIAAGASFVVIGGFAVIAHRYVRATEDVDLMIPEDATNDQLCIAALHSLDARAYPSRDPLAEDALKGRHHLRALTSAGLVDLLREGESPLDFGTVASAALAADLGAGEFRIAGLHTVVALKQIADRPRDRNDLAELERIHGKLPAALPDLDAET
ncbi:MAG: hypothetical protein M3355_07595 [Actinomycetota bacterium]|nr:hypothetical protein [Actinomycetota bacterium]